MTGKLLSIGHSSHDLKLFLKLLGDHQVSALADVRSRPRSGYSPHFNDDRLAMSLRRHDVSYVPMGAQLGGQPSDRSLWREGKPDFAAMSQRPELHAGLDRLQAGLLAGQVICLMCSEEDPALCHRHRLLWPLLTSRGLEVAHIRSDGRLEDPQVTDARVPARMRRQWQPGLF